MSLGINHSASITIHYLSNKQGSRSGDHGEWLFLMMDLEFAQLSDCGRVRDQNEDYLGHVLPATPAEARTHGWLFALADGVGGQQEGEVASRVAVESLLAGFRQAQAGELHAHLLARLV